eukprot:CAMPEP_0167761946 /NCGR_PEP_ID=MMETSP0110_2-20121227/12466_1 /TAXON_ID=629695 /ORGANISM="Gymnochlora sp., Strain CCMP2014" /LENGTH=104 /DNA_ID=CAMNT_0007648709 /DNA_START=651 /DNA_END=965 /DNA_ORIENTATION=-
MTTKERVQGRDQNAGKDERQSVLQIFCMPIQLRPLYRDSFVGKKHMILVRRRRNRKKEVEVKDVKKQGSDSALKELVGDIEGGVNDQEPSGNLGGRRTSLNSNV